MTRPGLLVAWLSALLATASWASTLAYDDLDASLNRISYAQSVPDFVAGGDMFGIRKRGENLPFQIADDSLFDISGGGVFAGDVQGIIDSTKGVNDRFFGAADTINPAHTAGPVTATWVFNVSNQAGPLPLNVSIDMAGMGNFETADTYHWTYQLDAGPVLPLFTSSVDIGGSQTYAMENPANNPVNIIDPLLVDGIYLDDLFHTFTKPLAGTGNTLTLQLSVVTDGSDEAYVFDNIFVTQVPEPSSLALLGLGGLAMLRRRRQTLRHRKPNGRGRHC